MPAKQLSKKHELYGVASQRSGAKCEAKIVTDWEKPSGSRTCGKPMDGEYLLDDGNIICLCRGCRLLAIGLLASEKRKRTIAKKEAQTTFLTAQQQKKVER